MKITITKEEAIYLLPQDEFITCPAFMAFYSYKRNEFIAFIQQTKGLIYFYLSNGSIKLQEEIVENNKLVEIGCEIDPQKSVYSLYQSLLQPIQQNADGSQTSGQTPQSEVFLNRFAAETYKFLNDLREQNLEIFSSENITIYGDWSFRLDKELGFYCICNNHTGKFMLKVQKGAHELPSRWVDDDISLADFFHEMRDFFHDVLSEPMHELLK